MTSLELQQKYNQLRPQIKNGSIINVRGSSLLTRTIEWADKAYYSHSLVVLASGNRFLAIQSMGHGVEPDFLSKEVFANRDFCIINPLFPQPQLDAAVDTVFNKAESGIPYNTWELPKILLKLKLGINSKNMQGNPNDNICSVFAAWTYGGLLPLTCYNKEKIKQDFITPQDLIRFADPLQVQIIGNDNGN